MPASVKDDLEIMFVKRIGEAIPLILEDELAPASESLGASPEPNQPSA